MDVGDSKAREIFHFHLRKVLKCRKSWPKYATHAEDIQMRKDKWKQKYEGKRVVMWDDTNINFAFKPSGAYEQRVTYSKYYATNCGKGGFFIQLGA